MKKIKHLRTIFWAFLMIMALGLPLTLQKDVFAEEIGSITVKLTNLDTPKNDVGFTAYRVCNWNGSEGKWALDDSLKDTGVELDKLEYATDWDSAALKLASAKGLEKIDSVSGKTDESGTMKLSESNAESSGRIHIRAPFPLGTEPLSSTENAFVRPVGGLTERFIFSG